MKRLLMIGLPAYALDQATKWAVVWTLPFDPYHQFRKVVIPNFFDLVHWGNTGAAFSFMSGRNTFFVILSLVALTALFIMEKRGAFADAWSRWGAGLLVGGVLGNVTDRLVHGHVVDFLLFDLHVPFANPWPAFNVADSCICIAVGLFFIASFKEQARVNAAKKAAS
ncbi:MAG: signal peptidase II [Chthoniobacteraceae bacterium]